MLVVLQLTSLLQIFSRLWFCLKDFYQNCQTACELCERRFAKTAPDCTGPSMAEWLSLGKVTVTSLLMGNSQGKVHGAMAIIKGRPKGYLHMLNVK